MLQVKASSNWISIS